MELHPCCTSRFVRCGHVIIPLVGIVKGVLGIDPSGGKAPWGYALLRRIGDKELLIEDIGEDEERVIIEYIDKLVLANKHINVMVVDAPLGFRLDNKALLRATDKVAISMGARLLPPGWKGMESLSRKGLLLYFKYSEVGVAVLETHPYSASRILNIDIRSLRKTLGSHAADALISAIVGFKWSIGESMVVCQNDGALVLPLGKARIIGEKIIV